MTECQLTNWCLTLRYREQARSYSAFAVVSKSEQGHHDERRKQHEVSHALDGVGFAVIDG